MTVNNRMEKVMYRQNGHPYIVGKSGAPALSIYLDLDGTTSINSTEIEITANGSTYTFPLVGRTLKEIAGDISSSSGFIHANPLNKSLPLSAGLLYIDSLDDKTADGGVIVRMHAHAVRYLEETQIRVLPPYRESRLLSWYPLIDRGNVAIIKDGVRYTYGVPEYYNQEWSTLFGAPYVDQLGAKAEFVDPFLVRVPRTPIFWHHNNLGLSVNGIAVGTSLIADVDIHNGYIQLNTAIEKGDRVLVDYVYREDRLVYKGLDLNPSMEHNPSIIDQTVLIYLLPMTSSLGRSRKQTVMHSVNKTLTGAISSVSKSEEPVLIIGAFQVRPSGVITDLTVTDTRTRGGGIREDKYSAALKRNREMFSVSDVGHWDGVAFPGAAAGILCLPKTVLDRYDKDYIEQVAQRHLAVGGNLLIDYTE